jgi:hypothetical protein
LRQEASAQTYRSERLAYWYFRLNGFLTTENFIVHSDRGANQRTDADLLAVRFAHRAELLDDPMEDDSRATDCETLLNVIVAEVKTGRCSLNGPWTDPGAGNMKRVLKSIGCVAASAVEPACKALYRSGAWSDAAATIRLFALGDSKDDSLQIPTSQQLTWSEVIGFCVQRFRKYPQTKRDLGQWPIDGSDLRNAARGQEPEAKIRKLYGLKPGPSHRGGT